MGHPYDQQKAYRSGGVVMDKKTSRVRVITFGQILIATVMTLFTLTILIPVLHIVARSFSDPSVSAAMSGLRIIPDRFNTVNYQIVLSNPVIIPAFFNSVFITVVGTLLNMLLTMMGAYALTRPGFVGKKSVMPFLIVMMLFDPGLVPEYLVIKDLGLMGSRWSVILILATNVYYLVILMRYFNEVPHSLTEAAMIDGAGHMRTLFSVVAPLSKAGIATITMFYAVVRWNEYVRSGLFITSIKKTTLQVILRKFVVNGDTAAIIGFQNVLNYNELARVDYTALQYATIVIAVVPILLIYPLVLKYYQKGVITGGVKE